MLASPEAAECHTAYLGLPASDRAAHDETMPPDPSIPFGSYSLNLDILKASLGEPLQNVTWSMLVMQSSDTADGSCCQKAFVQ